MDDPNKDAYGEHDKETPEGRVMHYSNWHIAAYGAPAPREEIVAQLIVRHGLKTEQALDLLSDMDARGQIELREHELGTEVVPNTPISGPSGSAGS